MRMHRPLAVLLMAVMVCAADAGEDAKAPEDPLETRVSVRFDRTTIWEVVPFLDEVTPLKYHLYKDDVPYPAGHVTLDLDSDLRTVLDLVCWLEGMAWKREGDTIEIGRPERILTFERKVYDVGDLIPDKWHGPELPGFAFAEGKNPKDPAARAVAMRQLVRLAMPPGLWTEKSKIEATDDPARLAVVQSPQGHAAVETLLAQLRGKQVRTKPTADEQEVIKHLDRKVSLRFDETPLRDVIFFLQEITPVDFALHVRDIPPDRALVTLEKDCDLRTGLDLICSRAGMAWEVKGPVIRIARPATLLGSGLRVHEIGRLLPSEKQTQAAQARALRRLIMEMVLPSSWRPDAVAKDAPPAGGAQAFFAAVQPAGLAVVQSDDAHALIKLLLDRLSGAEPEKAEPGKPPPEADQEVARKLAKTQFVLFVRAPVSDICAFLQEAAGVNIHRLDVRSDHGSVSIEMDGPIREILDKTCGQAGLRWEIEDGCVWIRKPRRGELLPTKQELEKRLQELIREELRQGK